MQPNIAQPFAVVGRRGHIFETPVVNRHGYGGKLVGQELGQGEVVRRNEHLVPAAMKLGKKGMKCVAMSAAREQTRLPTYFHTRHKRRHGGREAALSSLKRIRKLDDGFK